MEIDENLRVKEKIPKVSNAEDDLRKPEKTDAEIMTHRPNMHEIECINGQKKFRGVFRYSARTRVIID